MPPCWYALTHRGCHGRAVVLSSRYEALIEDIREKCIVLTQGVSTGAKGLDFMVHSVWPEIAEAITQRLGFIFAPGIANVFKEVLESEHNCSSLMVLSNVMVGKNSREAAA